MINAADLERQIMALAPANPCVVFNGIEPDSLAKIRASAHPQSATARIDISRFVRPSWGVRVARPVPTGALRDLLDREGAAFIESLQRQSFHDFLEVWRAVED